MLLVLSVLIIKQQLKSHVIRFIPLLLHFLQLQIFPLARLLSGQDLDVLTTERYDNSRVYNELQSEWKERTVGGKN
jgi:hypothetical protein